MLSFNGAPIFGLHEHVEYATPKLQAQRTKYAGIVGESETVLGAGGRALKCEVWLTDASLTTSAAVAAYVASLNALVGANGTLVVTEEGKTIETFADCTFEGFEATGPILPAIGGGMPPGTFWTKGVLHWYQLTVS